MTGLTGELIIETETDFVANPSCQLFSESERPIVNQIAHLGYIYKQLSNWVQKCTKLYHDQLLDSDEIGENQMEIEGRVEEETIVVSRFIRALNFAVQEIIDRFHEQILAIEQRFLYGTILNLGEFQVYFREFFDTLPELNNMVSETSTDMLNSCQILDFLHEKKFNGNPFLEAMYRRMFDLCWQAFLEVLSFWVLKGKVLRGPTDQFFIKRSVLKRKRRTQSSDADKHMDWNNDYILIYPLVPVSLISVKTAKSILFLGKMVKILKKEPIFADSVSKVLSLKFDRLATFEPFEFVQGINQMVSVVSRVFLEQILTTARILEELSVVRDYFLLFQDEFFTIFIEEAHDRLIRPPTKTAESEMNQKVLQNVLLRINKPKFERSFKKVKFVLKSRGFDYPNFVDKSNLLLLGDVEHNEFFLRFRTNSAGEESKASPAVWSVIKHYLEKNFQCNFAFRFKRAALRVFHDIDLKQKSQNKRANACRLTLVLQAKEEIRSSGQSKRLLNLDSLSEYVAVNFGVAIYENPQNVLDKRHISYISVVAKSKDAAFAKTLKEVKFPVDQLDFGDQDTNFAKIAYSQDTLRIFLDNQRITTDSRVSTVLEVPLQLSETLELDIGRAYIGLMTTVNTGFYQVDVQEWSLLCQASQNQSSGWGGLVPFYSCPWPVNIVMHESFFDRCSTLFGLIFPLKLAKYRLGKIHLVLTNLKDRRIDSKFFSFGHHLKHLLESTVTGLLEYIYADVMQKEWKRLETSLKEVTEFEQLLKVVDTFVDQVMSESFFDCPQLLNKVYALIALVDSVDSFTRNESRHPIRRIIDEFRRIRSEIEDVITGILRDLNFISQTHDSYGRLMLRIDFSGYYKGEVPGDSF